MSLNKYKVSKTTKNPLKLNLKKKKTLLQTFLFMK